MNIKYKLFVFKDLNNSVCNWMLMILNIIKLNMTKLESMNYEINCDLDYELINRNYN